MGSARMAAVAMAVPPPPPRDSHADCENGTVEPQANRPILQIGTKAKPPPPWFFAYLLLFLRQSPPPMAKENEGVVKATNATSGYNPAFYDPEPNCNNAWRMYRCVCLFLLCQLQHV